MKHQLLAWMNYLTIFLFLHLKNLIKISLREEGQQENLWVFTKFFRIYQYHVHTGPLTSYLDADPDLTKSPQFTAYSSNDSSSGGGASARPHPQPAATPTGAGTSRRPKGGRFTDSEIKVLRYLTVARLMHEK